MDGSSMIFPSSEALPQSPLPARPKEPHSPERELEQLRWARSRPVCPHCGFRHAYRLEGSQRVRFKCARCRKQYSARRGTVMERSNVPTAGWLTALRLFISAPGAGLPARIERATGVSYKTAWSMVQRMRAAPEDPLILGLRQTTPPPG
ncbi:hypothetical protein F11_14365 [Rhodospirillum rubrum F11]|nr:transposase [Rhodospirillum rubrum]AEO49335.1 hypothetical protein F11_14365 [Rhodospirillum rubrum F11]QXG79559.1 transposase [Rhodospirillum rubrum]